MLEDGQARLDALAGSMYGQDRAEVARFFLTLGLETLTWGYDTRQAPAMRQAVAVAKRENGGGL